MCKNSPLLLLKHLCFNTCSDQQTVQVPLSVLWARTVSHTCYTFSINMILFLVIKHDSSELFYSVLLNVTSFSSLGKYNIQQ